MPDLLQGLGVSAGVAAGPVRIMGDPPQLPEPSSPADRDAEAQRATRALAAVASALTQRAQTTQGQATADILQAQVMMVQDPLLADDVTAQVQAGHDAPHALDLAFAAHRHAFAAAGGYLAERITDLDDLRNRAIAACLGLPMPAIPHATEPFILIARDLAPADTAGLDPTLVLALITEDGGPTSHTAIIARAAGIPAVVRCPGALSLTEQTLVAVDGSTGEVRAGIDEAEVTETLQAEHHRRERLATSTGPGATADGHPVTLLANIGGVKDLQTPAAHTAQGVGLFRTELLYLDRETPPSLDEQIATYTEVFTAVGERRIVLRTLDAGADKPLPFLALAAEPNPALGIRGLRTAQRQPEVLDMQLRAVAEAARATEADVWVMAPMVATVAEANDFVRRCRDLGLPKAGVMVEIPAIALQATRLARVVDFLSIGTNDLSQYTFAADRQVGDLAELQDPWQPALLQLIAGCGRAGKENGIPVGICGEAAADPQLAPILVGLGVNSLSMAANAIAPVRESLAEHTFADCERLAKLALDAEDATAARQSS